MVSCFKWGVLASSIVIAPSGVDRMVVIAGQDVQLDIAGLGHIPALWRI